MIERICRVIECVIEGIFSRDRACDRVHDLTEFDRAYCIFFGVTPQKASDTGRWLVSGRRSPGRDTLSWRGAVRPDETGRDVGSPGLSHPGCQPTPPPEAHSQAFFAHPLPAALVAPVLLPAVDTVPRA